MRRGLAWLIGAGALLAVAVGSVVVVLPGIVGARAVLEARRRGVTLAIGTVSIRWLDVELRDIHVELEGVGAGKADFSRVVVRLDARLRPESISATGGRAEVSDAQALREQVDAWRARRAVASAAGAQGKAIVDADFDSVTVALPPDEQLEAAGVHVRHESGASAIHVGSFELKGGRVALSGAGVDAAFSGSAFDHSKTESLAVVWSLGPTDGATTPAPASPGDEPLPVEPAPSASKRKGRGALTEDAPPIPPLLPDLRLIRARASAAIAAAETLLPAGGAIEVGALSVRVRRGEEELALGSGDLDLHRNADVIVAQFSTSPLTHATPLAVRAELPKAGDIEVSVSGGPVSLGILGLHDGGLLHLLDVDRTTLGGRGRVVLDEKGESLTFDVEGAVRGLSMREPRLAREPVRGMDLGIRARGLIDAKGALRLDDAEASIGAAHASIHGGFSQTADRVAAAFDFDFPTSSCQALLTSLPGALLPTVQAARMDGTFSLRGRLAFDTRDADSTSFDYDVNDRCRLVDVPAELDKSRFSKTFSHMVYSKTRELTEETTGPGSANWTELDEISPFMQVAVLTTEDGAFFHHHGFSHAAIRHALIDDIKARRFIRGASTITMQLAKNLFLSREKTLSRKLEELVLADYLEQTFTKDEMMELYLNIIEFGPDIYGVTAAAEHYFGRRPSELNLPECLFLSSILPNPIAFHKIYEKGTQPSDGWMRIIRARIQVAAKNGLISSTELATALTEPVVFHHEGDPPPPPRAPLTNEAHPEGGGDWQELN